MPSKFKIGALFIIVIIIVAGMFLFKPGRNVVSLQGAGSTFVYPLMSKWISEFQKAYPNITVNYQAIGSGGGIRAIIDGTVDFAASDAPLNDEEYSLASGKGTILHIPITIGAVVIAYNIPGLNGRLKLTGEILAKIYLGEISKWNDPLIVGLNPDLNLPDANIIVVKRADGSGTTYVFTDYLSNVSTEWASEIGKTKIFDFSPEIGDRGISAKGNQGVTAAIQQNEYSIGYIELAYAIQNKLNTALIRNRDGYFVEANLTTILMAANNSVASLPNPEESWAGFTMVNAPGKLSYPIASFVYLLVYKTQRNYDKFIALKKWLSWIMVEGQKYAPALMYVPLPENLVNFALRAIDKIIYLK